MRVELKDAARADFTFLLHFTHSEWRTVSSSGWFVNFLGDILKSIGKFSYSALDVFYLFSSVLNSRRLLRQFIFC
jgi:hypothetical protein